MVRISKLKIFGTIFALIGITVLILISPIFSVREVIVKGNEKYSRQQIMDKAGISLGMNIFKFKYSNTDEKLMEDYYIKLAESTVDLPKTVTIDIIERKACGYVPNMGTYLYIDQDGYVLENSSQVRAECPKVTGLKFTEYSVGSVLDVENSSTFSDLMTMTKLLINYDFLDKVKEINIQDANNIHFYVNEIDVAFGNMQEADKKIRYVIEILNSTGPNEKGVLHFENPNVKPYLSH